MKKFTKEIKIALVVIAGLIILFFGMNYLKGLDIFSSSNKYFISFKDISGLASSSPIYADGYKVGVVRNINYDYNNAGSIMVEASIDNQLRIPKGSSAEIISDMLGNVKVNLLLANNPRERVEPGGIINGDINAGALGQMKDIVPAVINMLPKLDSIVTSLNILLADPSLANSLHNVEKISNNLIVTTSSLNTMLYNLNKDVPTLMCKAGRIMDNTEVLTSNLNKIDVTGTMSRIDDTLDNIHQFTSCLNNNSGSLGLLMNDPCLYNNLNATIKSADSLMIDLKAHPKRYVHFSIFGKKDK
ncbi:MAG: MlaD family protein [Paraprevotella sp.]|nr:MlaD family protein [Paraprevotella sp.]MDD5856485.1 MlaD family protein [Prevotella sp.]